MHPANPADHYVPIKGGRNAPLVATYAHTTPLVPPVAIAPTVRQPVVTDIVTDIKPSQTTNVTTTATTVATTAAAAQAVNVATTANTVTQPRAVQSTTTTTTATQQAAAVPLPTQTTSRPTQVVETLYPTAESRTGELAAVGTAAAVAGAAASTHTARTQPAVTQQTTTTQTTVMPAAVPVAAARKGLDLDVTATSVDSYAAPTPIHLTIHPDPTETSRVGATDASAADANAIAYLHSVHPALPVTAASTTGLQQPQPSHARRNSEGAATSVNGLWTPMGEQRVERDAEVATGAVAGAALGAAAMHRTELPASSVDRVQHVSHVSGDGRTAVPVSGLAAASPLVTGETSQVGGVQRITQVEQASGLRGERIAVASTQHAMPAAQTFASTTAPQVVMVPGVATASSHSSVQPPLSPAVHGDQVYASEAPVIPARPIDGTAAKTNTHDHQYYASSAPVERDAAIATAGVAAGAALGAAAVHRSELPVTAQGERIRQVEDVTGLSGEGRMAVPLSGVAATGPLVVGETRQLGGVERITQVNQVSGLSGERIAVANTQHAMPAAQTFTSTTGPAVVQVTDTTNLQGGFHTPVMVGAATAAPLVVGETHEVGVSEPFEEVDDVSRVRQGVPVAVTSTQRALPAGQLFTSTGAAQVVHVPGTYTANVVQPTETRFTQRFEGDSSVSSIRQVGDATALTGERLTLANQAYTRPLVTSTPAVNSQFESVTHVSNASHLQGELRTPIMVEQAARSPLVVGETAQLGSSTANVMHVSEMRGERLPVASTTTATTGAMRTMELVGESQQSQIRYSFDNNHTNQALVQPVTTVQNTQNVQSVQRDVENVHTVRQVPMMEERTTITREAVSAEEAAARTTTQAIATDASNTTYQSLTTQQAAGLEEQHQRIDGRTHIAYVDKSRMEGREAVPVGPYNAFTKDVDSSVDAVSSGVKDVQLGEDKERQSYTKPRYV